MTEDNPRPHRRRAHKRWVLHPKKGWVQQDVQSALVGAGVTMGRRPRRSHRDDFVVIEDNPAPRKTSMAKKKTARKTTKAKVAIPKGKSAGDHFKKGTTTYVVVSYVPKKGPAKGKRVRFARRTTARAAKRKTCR